MHYEELKRKPIPSLLGLILVFGIVFALYWLFILVFALQIHFKVAWIQFVLYGFLFFVGYMIIKKFLTSYIYMIEKDRVTFGRRIGKREKELTFIPFRDIEKMGPYTELCGLLKGKKVHRYSYKKKSDSYVLLGRVFSVIISPTDEYIDKLRAIKSGKRKADEPVQTPGEED
ncbi:MAG: hypothetical protein ACOYJB_08360 [Christensenellaceae bacterium]|jgi:hypothetical protein